MFTGIIHHQGRVTEVERQASGNVRLTIAAPAGIRRGLKIYESIAAAGVCLTVIKLGRRSFSAELMPETLRRTTLGALKPGAPVNLERSLRLGDRLSGHLVMGHVDGTALIKTIKKDGGARVLTLEPPAKLMPFITPKGTITLAGVSLTITMTTARQFRVALIPHTLKKTTLGKVKVGQSLNLEIDPFARLTLNFLKNRVK